jgi:predicted acyltransferase
MTDNPQRLLYLDQFRGYTFAGMILVNYLGHYGDSIPPVLRHHNTFCSYGATIMPNSSCPSGLPCGSLCKSGS